jgi:hypothetical protein
VGRHTADEGASAHPLVAAALEHRAPHGVRRHGTDPAQEQGNLGWPGPAPGGGGLGWPVDDSAEDAPAAEEPAPPARRRGWRRLFGARAA